MRLDGSNSSTLTVSIAPGTLKRQTAVPILDSGALVAPKTQAEAESSENWVINAGSTNASNALPLLQAISCDTLAVEFLM